ncbi:MAG: NAD(+)/NADH kinase [Gammaproteobacteria bacterium]
MSLHFSTVAVLGRGDAASSTPTLGQLLQTLEAAGAVALVDRALAPLLPKARGVRFEPQDQLSARADLAVVVGGDGTLLRAAHVFEQRPVPLVGINLGQLGFLTDISPASLATDLSAILQGEYQAEERLALAAETIGSGKVTPCSVALNDIVIQKADGGRLIEFETRVDGRLVCAYRADGIVIATPTGSTAYALSGGGAILHPALAALILVPICPHTLGDRPIVISGDSQVEVRIINTHGGNAQATSDGQPGQALGADDRVRIKRAAHGVTFIHPRGYDYYQVLRSKLHWGPVRLAGHKG